MGSAAPAVVPQPVAATNSQPQAADIEQVRTAVLNALSKAGQSILCSMLDGGVWKVEGNQLIISIAASATLIEMSVSADARRLTIAAASGVLGRAIKLQIVPGLSPAAAPPQKSTASYANGSSRARAEEEPVVRRMKEKFGAEIRTVIDYRKEK
jgi:DNA polymerase-3 subunit gamma/tau